MTDEAAKFIVSDWLGHYLYGFATEEEAREYVQRYEGAHKMHVHAATKWDRVPAAKLANIIAAAAAAGLR